MEPLCHAVRTCEVLIELLRGRLTRMLGLGALVAALEAGLVARGRGPSYLRSFIYLVHMRSSLRALSLTIGRNMPDVVVRPGGISG
jgi:hypothetical protein